MTDRFFTRRGVLIFSLVALFLIYAPAVAQSAGTYTLSGDELVDEGKFREAIVQYDKAIALEPRMAMAWCGKGVALNGLMNYTDAIAAFDMAISLNPGYAKAWYEKGNALYSLGKYEDAIAAYDKALEIYPEYGYLAYYGRANALAGMGRYGTAVLWYEKALLIEPRYAGAWAKKGDALAASGDNKGAIAAYDRALSLDPSYLPAQKGKLGAEANLSGTGTPTTGTRTGTVTLPPAGIEGTPPVSSPAQTKKALSPSWLFLAGIAFAVACPAWRNSGS